MSQLTVYLNKNRAVITATVTLTDATGKKTILTIPDFAPWVAGGAHTGDLFAIVKDFAALPRFLSHLEIQTGGGGRALVTFGIDGADLPSSQCLKADWQNTTDTETIP